MGVDVTDVGGVQTAIVKRVLHGSGSSHAAGPRQRHVIGVCRHPVAKELSVNPHPPGESPLALFQDQDGGAFTYYETVAVCVEGSRGTRGVVVTGAQSSRLGESRHGKLAHRSFGSSDDHDVGITTADDLGSVTDGVGRSGAGGDRGRVGAEEIE